MAKKSVSRYYKDELEIIKYQWESLRTKPGYIKDYRKFKKLIKHKRFNMNRYTPRVEYWFIKKYGIAPLDPSVQFPIKSPKITKRFNTSSPKFLQYMLWLYFVDMIKSVHCLSPELETYLKSNKNEPIDYYNAPSSIEELADFPTISLLVTLDAPLPKIIKEITEIVNTWKNRRNKIVKGRLIRYRLKEYRSYYKVFDLKSKGFSWNAIARKCYPLHAEKDIYYAKKKVKRDLTKWEEIGYLFKQHSLLGYKMNFPNTAPPQLLTNEQYYKMLYEYGKEALKTQ